jgi:Na+/H+ antiporter NhaC
MYIGRKHVKIGEITQKQFNMTFLLGLKSMLTAIIILILSWTIGTLIGHLEVGQFVANVLTDAGVYVGFLPLIMFVAAAFMAFSIGTSWGTFALVLPIAGAAAYAMDISLLLPAMSAVLSGAVWGDHASPISDTTVLASAGTSCDVVAHFKTQLPYAMIAAVIAMAGYTAFGLTRNIFVGYIGFAIAMGVMVFVAMANKKKTATA